MYSEFGLLHRLTAFFAVATLPVGILAFMFAGLQVAAVVFVVGWLLLVPGTAVLAGPPGAGTAGGVAELQEVASRIDGNEDSDGGGSDDATGDPVDELRDRYARGDISDAEFERQLEALLETEGLDPTDEAAVERAVERLNEGSGEDDDAADLERELE